MRNDEKIAEFCTSIKRGLGSIVDSSVKAEYERVNETKISPVELGKLLAILEKHNLLDKKLSVNRAPGFYQHMYSKMISPK